MYSTPVSEARMPSLASLPICTPGLGSSTTNRLIASGSGPGRVRAASSSMSAMGALVMYSLVPLSRQPPCTRSARVRSARMSEPASGSLRAKPEMRSPASAGRRKRAFCSALPARQMGQQPRCVCADHDAAKAWLTRLVSSRTMQSDTLSKPAPPSASG